MTAEITTARDRESGRLCQVGRVTYRVGPYDYVALTYRLLDPATPWEITWIGRAGENALRMPDGVLPTSEMHEALAEALA